MRPNDPSEQKELTSVVDLRGRRQVIVSGTRRIRGYDLATGKVIWECGGLSANIVASPVAAAGMVFAGSSYEKQTLRAIRLEGAKGDITGIDPVAWTRARGTPYVPSPLLYDGALYGLERRRPAGKAGNATVDMNFSIGHAPSQGARGSGPASRWATWRAK